MNRKIKQYAVRTALACLMAAAVPFTSLAATARIAFSDPKTEVGSEFEVKMKFTCTSGEVLGNTDVMLSYDANMLEFINETDNASGGTGAIRVWSGLEGKTEISTILRFKALQPGQTKITITSWEGYDNDGQYLDVEKEGSSAITIAKLETSSNDATLQSLQISPGSLEPSFSPSTETYTTTVGLDTERLVISAKANNENAKVSIEGDTDLTEGENTVICKVTAEDGSTVKNYTIVVNKVAGGEGEPTVPADSEQEILATLEASKTPLKIGIVALPDGVEPPAGLEESTISIGDAKVQGWVLDKTVAPDYCVFYGISEDGTAGFYRYDTADKTLQRYFDVVTDSSEEKPEYLDLATKYNELVDSYNLLNVIAIGCGAAAVVLLLVVIVMARKNSARNREEEAIYRKELEPKREEKTKAPVHGKKKLSKEERYMMGEEDEYEEESLEEVDVPEWEPENETDTPKDVPVREDIEEVLAAKLAKEAALAASEPEKDDEDDFEFFDL